MIAQWPAESTRKTGLFQPVGWEPEMPLVKSASKNAFRKNIAAEVKSGKPVKQAVAIAYSVKREAEASKSAKKSPTKSKK